ncbi:MAG: DUF1853 family protein [Sulfuriferula sp.]|nr:DUF1853 family protein [Sulfuriferula sp.]
MEFASCLGRFRDAQVRDLVWAMAAPGLLADAEWIIPDGECQLLLSRAMPQLLALDRQPEALHAWIAARNPHRLGRYFEVLLGYWFTYLIDTAWFAANRIVKSGRNVTGEFDLLWCDSTGGNCQHWEVAVKFYLQVDAAAGFAGYVGPMLHDRLDLKVTQLHDKQLQLSQTPAGAAALAEILPASAAGVRARALLKGWLFYPAQHMAAPATGISAAHLAGWWMRWSAADFCLPPGLRWLVLDRLHWLSPAGTADTPDLLTESECMTLLAAHFAAGAAPLLLAGLDLQTTGWQEATRGFIVPPAWGEDGAILL